MLQFDKSSSSSMASLAGGTVSTGSSTSSCSAGTAMSSSLGRRDRLRPRPRRRSDSGRTSTAVRSPSPVSAPVLSGADGLSPRPRLRPRLRSPDRCLRSLSSVGVGEAAGETSEISETSEVCDGVGEAASVSMPAAVVWGTLAGSGSSSVSRATGAGLLVGVNSSRTHGGGSSKCSISTGGASSRLRDWFSLSWRGRRLWFGFRLKAQLFG